MSKPRICVVCERPILPGAAYRAELHGDEHNSLYTCIRGLRHEVDAAKRRVDTEEDAAARITTMTWRVGPSIGKCTSVQNSTGGVVCVTIDDPSVAPLITAAPDVLEAAQAVIEAWGIPHGKGVLEKRMYTLRAAVEKASGE